MRHRRARRAVARSRLSRRRYDQGRTAQGMGRHLERKAGEALALLKEWECIASYDMSRPNDDLDKAGVDACFTRLDGTTVKFQIKSSDEGVRRHRMKHPDIPCVNLGGYTFAPDIAVFLQWQFDLPERSSTPDDDA